MDEGNRNDLSNHINDEGNCIDFTKNIKDIEHNKWLKDNMDKADELIKKMLDDLQSEKDPRESKLFLQKEFQNVIAFTGDRGSGKTTMLNSYIKSMQLKDNNNCKFLVLPIIDPSRHSDGDSLLCAVFARLFDWIKQIYENGSSNNEAKEKCRKYAKDCSDIMDKIRIKAVLPKESKKDYSDSTDYMEEFSTVVRLREKIFEFLKNCLEELAEKKYLIIPIDDLDTNIRNGYDIIREIHQYLSLPNIIIIMAVKIEQLSDLIRQKYISDFGSAKDLAQQPSEMAVKYLEKVIPIYYRIPMRQLRLHNLCNISVKFHLNDKSLNPLYKKIKENEAQVEEQGIGSKKLVELFFDLIYDKTLINLVKDDSGAHPLIPRNLRALHNTLKMLNNLDTIHRGELEIKDIEKDKEKIEKGIKKIKDERKEETKQEKLRILEQKMREILECEEHRIREQEKLRFNLEQVETWLIESITSNAVPQELAVAFHDMAVHPSRGFCAFIVQKIRDYNRKLDLTKRVTILSEEDSAIKAIFEAVRPDKTCCLGDILYLLDKITERNSDEGYSHFAAAVKMLFSLRVTFYLMANDDSAWGNVSSLLGSLIVHPKVRLTAMTGSEWNKWSVSGDIQVKVTSAEGNNDQYSLKSGVCISADNIKEKNVVSLKAMLWLSMFVVTTYDSTDYHKPCSDEWIDRLPYLGDNNKGAVFTTHWMRFATAFLEPEESYTKLLWMLGDFNEDNDSDQSHKITKSLDYTEFKKDFIRPDPTKLPLPLNSIDILHALSTQMNRSRLTTNEYIRNYLERNSSSEYVDIEYRIFRRNLYEALKSVLGIEPIKCPPDNINCTNCDKDNKETYDSCINHPFMENLRKYTPPKVPEAEIHLEELKTLRMSPR